MTSQEEKDLRDQLAAATATNAAHATQMAAATEAARVATFSARKAVLTSEFSRIGMAAPDDKLVEGYMSMNEDQFGAAVAQFKAAKPVAATPAHGAHLFQQTMIDPKGPVAREGDENPVVKFSQKMADGMKSRITRESLLNQN